MWNKIRCGLRYFKRYFVIFKRKIGEPKRKTVLRTINRSSERSKCEEGKKKDKRNIKPDVRETKYT